MDNSVVKRLALTFALGGAFGAASQVLLWVWRAILGATSVWAVPAMLATLGAIGAVLFVFGIYQKLEKHAAMGAIMPFSGLVSAVAASFIKGYENGGTASGVWEGFKFFLYVLGVGSCLTAITAVVIVMCG